IKRSEIYSGELYDARDESVGWNQTPFADGKWRSVAESAAPNAALVAQLDTPARIVQTIKPATVTPVNGTYVFDMGQNMVGWAKLQVTGPSGTRVRLRFAERLNPDGSIYTENLRNADATDIYVLRGGGDESFIPSFTFHGFRYVEVTGFI